MFEALFGGGGGRYFNRNYRAYPVAFCEKESAEKGDKIIMPTSALHMLASMHVEYPMLFRIENTRDARHSHCGVLEFVAQEGMCYLPKWMMDNLLLTEGDLVNIKNVSLPKGRFIKIQPHTSDFLDISNPKAVLETSLRNFTCLTKGDTFVIDYNARKYHIDVVDVKPDVAVSVVETDLEVDFDPPKDYKEPEYKPPAVPASADAGASASKHAEGGATSAGPAAADAADVEEKVVLFGGTGRRLDGKAAGPSAPVHVPVSELGRERSRGSARLPAPGGGDGAAGASGNSASGSAVKAGKVVVDDERGAAGNRLAARLAKQKAGGQEAPRKPQADTVGGRDEAPSFAAFQGKARSLKD